MTLKTNDKQILFSSGMNSVIDEIVIPSNSSVVQLGQNIQFNHTVGQGDRDTIKLINLMYECKAHINSTVSSYSILFLWALIEYYEIYINGVSVFKKTSPQVNDDMIFINQYHDYANNPCDYINELQELSIDADVQPYNNGSRTSTIDGTQASHRVGGAGRDVSFDLVNLFPEWLKNLTFHKIKTFSILMRFRNDTGAALRRYMTYNLVAPDTSPNLLPQFTSTQLRLRYQRYHRPIADPCGNLPLTLLFNRCELKNFGVVFNNTVSVYKVNLSQQAGWSNIKNLQETWLYMKHPTYQQESYSNSIYQTLDWIGFAIYINGKLYAKYLKSDYRNYINEYYKRQTGHYPFWCPQLSVTGAVSIDFLNEQMFPLRIDWTGIRDAHLGAKKNDIEVVGGIDNYAQCYEVEIYANPASFITGGPRVNHSLEVINMSKTLVSVYGESKVEVAFS